MNETATLPRPATELGTIDLKSKPMKPLETGRLKTLRSGSFYGQRGCAPLHKRLSSPWHRRLRSVLLIESASVADRREAPEL